MTGAPLPPARPAIDWDDLRKRRWSIIPLKPGSKEPALPWKRFQSEYATSDEIAKWAATDCNVGIVTGVISGLVVLDCDTVEAVEQAEALGVVGTLSVGTSQGRHFYFDHPGGFVCNLAKFRPGMDLRGDGGYVVGPGSVHPHGAMYSALSYWP